MANDDRLLLPAQVARRLNVKRAYVLRLLRQRRLTGIRLGGHGWRVEPQAVNEYIAAHRQDAATAEAPAVDDRQLALFDPPAADAALRLSLADKVVTTLAEDPEPDAALRLSMAATLVGRIAANEDERTEAPQ